MKNPKARPSLTAERSTEYDWNFDNVPDGELVACCYWEYARESSLIRDTLLEMRVDVWESFQADRKLENTKRAGWCDKLSRIQSIGYRADVFVRGSVFQPGTFWQSMNPKQPNYRHPDAPPLTGCFPAPWQTIAAPERQYRARIKTAIEDCRIVPVRMGQWQTAREIVRHGEGGCQRAREDWNVWSREHTGCDADGNCYLLPNAPDFPPDRPVRPGIFFGNAESLLVEIAWEDFTDDEIATCFRKWVKHARPETAKAPSGKGHKPGDWRAQLTRLSVMRLLSRYTPKEIIGTKRTAPLAECQPIHNTKQFARSKWGDPTKWYDARREAGELFHELFPFLPKDDKPLSWQRQSPAI